MELVIESGNLEYTHIAPKFQDFIDNWDIKYYHIQLVMKLSCFTDNPTTK